MVPIKITLTFLPDLLQKRDQVASFRSPAGPRIPCRIQALWCRIGSSRFTYCLSFMNRSSQHENCEPNCLFPSIRNKFATSQFHLGVGTAVHLFYEACVTARLRASPGMARSTWSIGRIPSIYELLIPAPRRNNFLFPQLFIASE
jgi:hypothetical protein